MTTYPQSVETRAFARQFALVVACDIHPLNNLRVLKYLKRALEQGDEARHNWYHHWVRRGFTALEKLLDGRNRQGPYCLDGQVTEVNHTLAQASDAAQYWTTPHH